MRSTAAATAGDRCLLIRILSPLREGPMKKSPVPAPCSRACSPERVAATSDPAAPAAAAAAAAAVVVAAASEAVGEGWEEKRDRETETSLYMSEHPPRHYIQ